MTDAEFDRRLRDIAALSKSQREGPFTPQSDAVQALVLIETMALLLIEMWDAKEKA